MNLKKLMLAALAMVMIVSNAGCKNSAAADPFPASGAVAGWQKTTDTRAFAAKDLWQYIDGDSEQYIQSGVVSTSTSEYKYQDKLEAVVDIYTMSASDGAQTMLRKGKTNEAKTVALGDEGLQYAQSVYFRKGRYLVKIVAYEASAATPQTLLALAHGVEAHL